ncbi:MAG: SH3 domain-containing protein, partial [Pseudomonadota bacterium]|nr:SH3 domain-containing protein [Pseudomonadota bacterium]
VLLLLAVVLSVPFYQNQNQQQEVQVLREQLAESQADLQVMQKHLAEVEKKLAAERQRRKNAEILLEKIKRFEDVQATENQSDEKPNKYFDVVSVRANDVLNVRSFPGHVSPKTGQIPPNGRCILYLGKFRIDRLGNVWVLIEYKNIRGWVNSQFLLEKDQDEHCQQ